MQARPGGDAGPAAVSVSAAGPSRRPRGDAAWPRLPAVLVFCAAVCRRRRGGVCQQRFARAFSRVTVVVPLDVTVQGLTSNTVVMGLVAPAVSCAVDDTLENSSLFGMASMAPLASFPS